MYRVIKNKVMQQDLSHFTVEDLQARCRQRSPGSNAHEEYCFELFRRAIVEKDNACWTAIYTQYEGLVMHWFKEQVPEGRIGDVPVSQMLTYPFEKLWRFFEAPKLAAARSLGSLLDYLHSCTITCVHEQYRAMGVQKNRETREFNYSQGQAPPVNPERSLVDREEKQQLWDVISANTKDDKEELIAWLTFTNGLKPARVYDEHPDRFESVDEVYAIKRRLIARLRRDPSLRKIWNQRVS